MLGSGAHASAAQTVHNPPARRLLCTGDSACELGGSGTSATGKGKDLAGVEGEGDAPHCRRHVDVVHVHQGWSHARSGRGPDGCPGDIDACPEDQFQEVSRVAVHGSAATCDDAVPKDGDGVRDLENLIEMVGDEDDRDTVGTQRLDDREELLSLVALQRRRRLVHDDDPRV